MKKEWYDKAFDVLARELSEKEKISGVEFLSDFFVDYHPTYYLQGGNDEISADDYAREEVDEFESWLNENKGEFLVVGNRYSWGRISNDTITLGKSRNKSNFYREDFNEEENLLLNKSVASLVSEDYDKIVLLYEKVVSGCDKGLIAQVALKVAAAIDLSNTDYEEKVDRWDECGDKEDVADNPACYKRYSKAALIAALNLNHLKSAHLYEKAKKSCDKYEKNERVLIDLIRCARRQYELSASDKDASRLYIEENNALIKNYCWFKSIPQRAYGWISDYGESPGKVLFSAFIVIILCASFYSSEGVYSSGNYFEDIPADGGDKVVQFFSSEGSNWEPLGIGLYYSVVTFTTLGYGDFSPASTSVRCVSACQALLGLMLTSLFMITVVRKYSR